jgi:hypothetical protein
MANSSTVPSSTNVVNPFYIGQDNNYDDNDDDGQHSNLINKDWADEVDDEEDDADDGYYDPADSQQPYHDDRRRQRQQGYDGPKQGGFSNLRPRQTLNLLHNNTHEPQYWKYGLLLGLVVLLVFFMNEGRKDDGTTAYSSLIDMIPDDVDEIRLVLLGERHSGVTWMQERLEECFPQKYISTRLQRNGHFFQDDESSLPIRLQNDLIVLHMTLNIYDWLEQMRRSPDYSPNHVAKHPEGGHLIPLDWNEFLTRPWTMPRPERDIKFWEQISKLELDGEVESIECQMRFHYSKVVSCVRHGVGGPDNPIYELRIDKDDESPYESIIDLRAAKIRNHQNVIGWKRVRKVITSQYERVGEDMKKILQEIVQITGWEIACTGEVLPPSLDRLNDMPVEFVEYVTQHADWDAEGLVSYEPRTVAEMTLPGPNKNTGASSSITKQTGKTSNTQGTGSVSSESKDRTEDEKLKKYAPGKSKSSNSATTTVSYETKAEKAKDLSGTSTDKLVDSKTSSNIETTTKKAIDDEKKKDAKKSREKAPAGSSGSTTSSVTPVDNKETNLDDKSGTKNNSTNKQSTESSETAEKKETRHKKDEKEKDDKEKDPDSV